MQETAERVPKNPAQKPERDEAYLKKEAQAKKGMYETGITLALAGSTEPQRISVEASSTEKASILKALFSDAQHPNTLAQKAAFEGMMGEDNLSWEKLKDSQRLARVKGEVQRIVNEYVGAWRLGSAGGGIEMKRKKEDLKKLLDSEDLKQAA